MSEFIHRNDAGHVLAEKSRRVDYWTDVMDVAPTAPQQSKPIAPICPQSVDIRVTTERKP